MRRTRAGARLGRWLPPLLLTVAVFVTYIPAWHGGLIWDDDAHVTSPELRSMSGLARIWFELGATQQYYPLLHSAFWLQHRLWGDATFGYHLVNLALHALAAILLAGILRRLAIPGAWLAAAMFALHPVHVESVAWITELKNTLSAVFALGAVQSYLEFDQARDRRSYGRALLLFVLGLLSKTATATFAGAIPVILWWKRGRLSGKRDLLPVLPFVALSGAFGLLTAWVEKRLIGAHGAEWDLSILERAGIAGRAAWFYLGKLLWPVRLAFIYPRWQVRPGVSWQLVFPLAALILVVVLWKLRRRTRAPLAAALYFVGTLVPVLGFLDVYPFRYSFVADHFQYLASLGIIVPVAAGVAIRLERAAPRRRLWGRVATVCVLAVLAVLSWRQCGMYRDAETLYRTTIARNPACWMARVNLGVTLETQGRTDEAVAEYQEALRVKPEDVDARGNLGHALASQGKLDEAIEQLRIVVRERPGDTVGRLLLGNALAQRGNLAEAEVELREVLRLQPSHAGASSSLANVLRREGRIAEALRHYEESLRQQPDLPEVLNTVAWIRATHPDAAFRDGAQAVRLAERACRISTRQTAELLDTLGAAYAEAGRYAEAVATARSAVELARTQGRQALADEIARHLALYEAGRPYREPATP
jgi:protein O-mannosyl-transferase